MPKLFRRDTAGTALAGGGSSISLGVIIAIVISGTVLIALAGGLLCARVARRKRHKRRQLRRLKEEETSQKEMMSLSMMPHNAGSGRLSHWPSDTTAVITTTTETGYFRPSAPASDCSSSTCCSLASSRGTTSTIDGNFEGSGITWWWRWHWRQFWHDQRRWFRHQKRRVPAVLNRAGSHRSDRIPGGNGLKPQSQVNHCHHDHGHHGHHHHRRATLDGSPRKLRRRRPETSIISATSSLFFPFFPSANDNNSHLNTSDALNNIELRKPSPAFSIVRANSYPSRPQPPAGPQRLLPSRSGSYAGAGAINRTSAPSSGSWINSSPMPGLPSNRYHPQNAQNVPSNPPELSLDGPSLHPPPPISTRSLPRPPQPALIIPDRPESHIPPGIPFYPNAQPQQQQNQMMIMMQQQQQQQQQQRVFLQMQMQQQKQYHEQDDLQEQQPQQHQTLQKRHSRRLTAKTITTDSALTEILRSTEQRLMHLQSQQPGTSLTYMKSISAKSAQSTATGYTDEGESIKRTSQNSGSDADSMFVNESCQNNANFRGSRDLESSPILDAIPTPLSSPSKSPNKNRIAAGVLPVSAGSSLQHPLILSNPAVILPQPPSSVSMSSPETRSPSSMYSSSIASSRSSLSTVYSADERPEVTEGSQAAKAGPQDRGTGEHADMMDGLDNHGLAGASGRDMVPAALSPSKSRASRALSEADIPSMKPAPDVPPRSPKRSPNRNAFITPTSLMVGGGVAISHGLSGGNNLTNPTEMGTLSGDTWDNTAQIPTAIKNGGHNRYRRRDSMVWQQQQNSTMANNFVPFSYDSLHANSQFTKSSQRAPPDDLSEEKTPSSTHSFDVWRRSLADAPRLSYVSTGSDSSANHEHSMMASSPTLAPDDETTLVRGRSNRRTSWGSNHQVPPHPPMHGRRSLQERVEALQLVQAEEEATTTRRQTVRPLPRPPSSMSAVLAASAALAASAGAGGRNSVMEAAAELRRMNSVAYSESSSCYSNSTSVIGKSPTISSGTTPTMHTAAHRGLSGGGRSRRNSGVHRRSGSFEDIVSGGGGNRSSTVGSRQYLALGKKRVSQVGAATTAMTTTTGGCDKENHDVANKRSSAPAAAASNRTTPQRKRPTRPMTMTGTTLRRVDENPASGTSTPSGTPIKAGGSGSSSTSNPTTPKANTGRPLKKSPSRANQVGNAAMYVGGTTTTPTGSPSKARSAGRAATTAPSTPTKDSMGTSAAQPTENRDSLGLYDQDGFLLSSPSRK